LTSLHSGEPLCSVPSQVLADLENLSPPDNRDQNVSRNTELLLATDIHKLPTAPSPASTTPKKPAQPKKTKVNRPSTSLPPDKQDEERDKAGLRSSTRVRGQTLDAKQKEEEAKKLVELRNEEDEEEGSYYENGKRIKTESGYGALIRSLVHSESCVILRFTWNADDSPANNAPTAPTKLGKRLYNPKRFGHIPGIQVGEKFAFRMEASQVRFFSHCFRFAQS